MPFEITLENNKVNSYKRSFVIIIILNLVAFLLLAYFSKEATIQKNWLFAAGCIAISLILDLLIKKKERLDFRSAPIILSIFFYLRLQHYWFGIILLLISALYLVAVRTLKVHISSDNIIFPSFPKKRIYWNEINNIILKDSLLTIDLKNNKLIQQLIDESKKVVNEQEFNDFCRQQLNK